MKIHHLQRLPFGGGGGGGLEETDVKSEHKVLGMNWDCEKDTFCFKLLKIPEFGQQETASQG